MFVLFVAGEVVVYAVEVESVIISLLLLNISLLATHTVVNKPQLKVFKMNC